MSFTLADIIRRHAADTPDAPADMDDDEDLSAGPIAIAVDVNEGPEDVATPGH